ncbi:hypothetical protein ACVRZR_01470 [Streptococcus entericus]|nr:hypothetical protein [Streptococcus entericus]
MSNKIKEMIYIKGDRIYFTPFLKEYDVTDHITTLLQELRKLKER